MTVSSSVLMSSRVLLKMQIGGLEEPCEAPVKVELGAMYSLLWHLVNMFFWYLRKAVDQIWLKLHE